MTHNTIKKSFILFAVAFLAIAPIFASADGGLVIFPPEIFLNEAQQNAIVAWNGEEEVFILSVGVKAGTEATVLKIVPLPANPSVEEGDFEAFEKLANTMNGKRIGAALMSGKNDSASGGVEITFHEKVGAHDVTVAKVNDLNSFLAWVESYLSEHQIAYSGLSNEFKQAITEYMERNIRFFSFDLIDASQETVSVNPIVYKFPSDYLFYPLEITYHSYVDLQAASRVSLFLLSNKTVSYLAMNNLHLNPWFDVELTHAELSEISPHLSSLFSGSANACFADYYGGLYALDRDLVMADLVRAANDSRVYQIISGKKLWIPSIAVFDKLRYNWSDINITSPSVPYVNLIKGVDDYKVYYLNEAGVKRHLANIEIFNSYGNKWENVVEIPDWQVAAYQECNLIRKAGDYKVYNIGNGTKRWVTSIEAFNRLGYDWNRVMIVNETEFNSYSTGSPIY